jgi:hypothetical protein
MDHRSIFELIQTIMKTLASGEARCKTTGHALRSVASRFDEQFSA